MHMRQHSRADLPQILAGYILDSGNPDMLAYGQKFLASLPRGLRSLQRLMRVGHLRHTRVLDVGCGFGWHAVCLSILGDNDVVALDIRDQMIHVLQDRLEAIRSQGIAPRVSPLLGDICQAALEPASFGGIFCNQTIEHVHDLDGTLQRFYELLRPGGRCVIVDDNNALNPDAAGANQAMWHLRDGSQPYIEQLKRQRPIENADIEPYATMRSRIIAECRPSLTADQMEQWIAATAGLTRPQIQDLLASWEPSAPLPCPPAMSWCRNPETGEYCERLLDPFAMACQMRQIGFRASVQHLFTRPGLRWLNRTGLAPLQKILFQRRGIFVLVGCKPHR